LTAAKRIAHSKVIRCHKARYVACWRGGYRHFTVSLTHKPTPIVTWLTSFENVILYESSEMASMEGILYPREYTPLCSKIHWPVHGGFGGATYYFFTLGYSESFIDNCPLVGFRHPFVQFGLLNDSRGDQFSKKAPKTFRGNSVSFQALRVSAYLPVLFSFFKGFQRALRRVIIVTEMCDQLTGEESLPITCCRRFR